MSSLVNKAVSVVTLGRMGFMAAYDVQMRCARNHLDELAGKPHAHGVNTLFLVEHTPVFTLGIRTKNYRASDEARLKKAGAEFYKTNRGGLITFHGPGQLVAYPVLNLQHFKPSMRWYVSQLEQTMINTLEQFGLKGRTTDQTGVWVEDRKIGSIGLHGSRYITTHGISLNCNVDLSWFDHIVPCGLEGVEMTSLSKELDTDVPYQRAVKPFLRCFQEVFDCDLEFKMLDQKELESMSIKPRSSSSMEYDGGNSGVGRTQRAEYGIRHISTSSGSPSTVVHPKNVPMW